jgi:RNA polymerase sigma-70 factor, ECF subfamily
VNREDFGRVYDEEYPRVFRFLLWRLGNKQAAEELTGEVFGVALSALQKGDEPARVGRWLVDIADRLASRSLRREQRDRGDLGPAFAVEQGPDEVVMGQFEGAGIWSCMEALAPAHRQVLLLRIVAGLTSRDVADHMGTTEEAVRSLQLLALQALQESWKETANADRHTAQAH